MYRKCLSAELFVLCFPAYYHVTNMKSTHVRAGEMRETKRGVRLLLAHRSLKHPVLLFPRPSAT